MKSALRTPQSGSRPRCPVKWDSSLDNTCTVTGDSYTHDNGELAGYEKRVQTYDNMYNLLHLICHTEDRWIPYVPAISSRRSAMATDDAMIFWCELEVDSRVPHQRSEIVPNSILPLRIMEKIWNEVYHCIFEERNEHAKRKAINTIESTEILSDWEQLAQRIIKFLQPFEWKIKGPDYAHYISQVQQLCRHACDLRTLMSADKEPWYYIYMPARYYRQDKRYELLRNDVDVYKTIGANHANASRDVVCMTLCGALVRGNRRRKISRSVERKAMCVVFRPGLDREVKMKTGGEEEELQHRARVRADRLEKEVREDGLHFKA